MTRSIDLVAVGVDITGVLTGLSGAASGAKSVAGWLEDQVRLGANVRTTVLTDEGGASVDARTVQNAAQRYVDERACDLLILYFAGHGIVKGGGDEQVLLSGIKDHNDEAIDIAATAVNARFSGIKHVLIVSDACRSPVVYGGSLDQVSGKPAIKRGNLEGPKSQVDVYYATEPSRTAKEYKGVGFFTEMLLSALEKCPPEIRTEDAQYDAGRAVVPSHKLAKYLEDIVPIEASQRVPPFEQTPDIIVSSHVPRFVAYAPDLIQKGAAIPTTPQPEHALEDRKHPALAKMDALRNIASAYVSDREGVRQGFANAGITDSYHLEAEVDSYRRMSFETRTGYIVVGAKVEKVLINGGEPDLIDTAEGTDIRLYPRNFYHRHQGSVIIFLRGGTVTVLPVMPGYIGTLGVQDGRVRALSFQFSDNERRFLGITDKEVAEMAQRRAAAAGLAASGRLWRLAKGDALYVAEFVRQGKRIDPTLGIFSAYAYFTAGNDEQVKSVFDWMAKRYFYRPEDLLVAPVPFDVAMLAGEITPENAIGAAGFAPFCPMLTLGWSLLEACTHEYPLHEEIIAARNHRLNAEWTTFEKKDVQGLIAAFLRGEIQ